MNNIERNLEESYEENREENRKMTDKKVETKKEKNADIREEKEERRMHDTNDCWYVGRLAVKKKRTIIWKIKNKRKEK